jgi:hypothetical protein
MGKPGPALFELIREPGATKAPVPPARASVPITPARNVASGSAAFPVASGPAQVSAPKPRVRLATTAPAAPLPVNEPKPEPKPEPSRGPGVPRPAFKLRRPVTVTMSGVLLVGAGALVLVILVATAVYTLGFKDGQTRVLSDHGLNSVTVTDPLKAEQVPLNPSLVVQETAHTAPAPKPASPPKTVPSAPATAEFVAGLNYCVAASRLDKDAAERAAAYLTSNGLPAAALLEGSWAPSKNGGSFRVVIQKGITGKEYGSRAAARTDVENQLAKLGQLYKKDPKGRLDFGQPSWEKKKD